MKKKWISFLIISICFAPSFIIGIISCFSIGELFMYIERNLQVELIPFLSKERLSKTPRTGESIFICLHFLIYIGASICILINKKTEKTKIMEK